MPPKMSAQSNNNISLSTLSDDLAAQLPEQFTQVAQEVSMLRGELST